MPVCSSVTLVPSTSAGPDAKRVAGNDGAQAFLGLTGNGPSGLGGPPGMRPGLGGGPPGVGGGGGGGGGGAPEQEEISVPDKMVGLSEYWR